MNMYVYIDRCSVLILCALKSHAQNSIAGSQRFLKARERLQLIWDLIRVWLAERH